MLIRRPARVGITVLFCLTGITFVYPFFWLLVNSLKRTQAILMDSLSLPRSIYLQNYSSALLKYGILQYFMNSVLVTVAVIVLTLMVTIPLAYAFGRMKWKLRGILYNYIMLGFFIPGSVTFVASYRLIRSLGLINGRFGIILPYTAAGIVMATILAYAFLRTIPSEMEEAAVMDGCGIVRIILDVMLPMLKPVLAAISINAFLNTWNEYLLASIVIRSDRLKTLPIGLETFVGTYTTDLGPQYAAMVITLAFPLIVFFVANRNVQKVFAAGVTLK